MRHSIGFDHSPQRQTIRREADHIASQDGLELEPAAHPPAEEDESRAKLPTSVRESLEALEADERIAGALGEDFVTAYGVMRRHELSRLFL